MEAKLYILAISANNHADILTNLALEELREQIIELQLLNLHHITDDFIIYAVNAKSLAGLHIMSLQSRMQHYNIDCNFQVVTF